MIFFNSFKKRYHGAVDLMHLVLKFSLVRLLVMLAESCRPNMALIMVNVAGFEKAYIVIHMMSCSGFTLPISAQQWASFTYIYIEMF